MIKTGVVKIGKLSPASSLLLDVLRFAAAVSIALAHLTQPFFSKGWPLLIDKAKVGLVALFLMSGIVIRYVTVMRRGRIQDFCVDRASRVYSVVIPSLLFTIVASYAARAANPAYYNANWGADMSHPVWRIFVNLIFFAQSWNWTYAPLSNEPFWTLSYEVFYYAIYAVLLYFGGFKRWFWFVALCILAGQHIVLLLPLWLFGCVLHDMYQRFRAPSISAVRLHLGFLGAGLTGVVVMPYLVRLIIAAKNVVTRLFLAHHHRPVNLHWAYIYYAIGLPLGFGLLWSMLLLERLRVNDKTSFARAVRVLSEATFPIYLIHFPLFVLIAAIIPYNRYNSWFKLGMLALLIVISVPLAQPTSRFKNYLRDLIKRHWLGRRQGSLPQTCQCHWLIRSRQDRIDAIDRRDTGRRTHGTQPASPAAQRAICVLCLRFHTIRPAPAERALLPFAAMEIMTDHGSGIVEQIQAAPEPKPRAWIKTELARHSQRPYPMDFIRLIFTDLSEIHGDRSFADDPAMQCSMARFHGQQVLVVSNVKGRTTKENVKCNFGLPNPEGYRKALRVMKIAEKFGRPIFTFIDLLGANPGLGAEERGQAEAIARNLREMSRLKVPTIAVVTGEGGSGGALALAVADRVLMLENAVYSVISPEGCASIMWRDAGKRAQAAAALKTTSDDVRSLGCVDDVVPEPGLGAHTDEAAAAALLDEKLLWHLSELKALSPEERLTKRRMKFRNIAQFYTS